MTSEEEVTIDINGRTYIIEFSSMQQVSLSTLVGDACGDLS